MPPGDANDHPDDAVTDPASQRNAAVPAEAPAQGLPAISPDLIEETLGDELDDAIPTYGYRQLPVVALGGSAGGIQALKGFFEALSPVTGMAYVVILHLSPEYESTLPELLQASTHLPVKAAEDGERLQPDRVYVIPPRKHLTLTNGHLRLSPLEPERGKRVAVDLFFRSLADTHGAHATAIVLSGVDSDGAIGIKRVKERGGLTIAQEPAEAEHEGMPRAAITTGMVDWVLPAADIPARLARYRDSENRLRLPSEDGPQPARPLPPARDADETALRETLNLLRARTGSDFTYYKRATILRRLARRMQINDVTTLPDYLTFLRTHAGEAPALLQDLLVSVTNFFRDRDAFAAVEALIPSLFTGKGPNDTVRVWSAACATGEETYSLAMLLAEHARQLDQPPTIQVFGCDLDEHAIQIARTGLYLATIAADVSEERLGRFFIREPRGYRVRRELREIVLFAEHDLLKDAPFSRMDLVSCRNLLIYLDREAQGRALEILHFALKPGGLLFLGSAESVDEEKALFHTLDKKHCLFTRRASARIGLPVPMGTGTLHRTLQAQTLEVPVVPALTFVQDPVARPPAAPLPEERASLAELHFRLIEHYAPPSVIVNPEGSIVHLSENADRFLRAPGGQPTASFIQSVLPELRMDLRAALLRVEESNAPVEVFGVPVELDGAAKVVDLRVAPAGELAPGCVLVNFAVRTPDAASAATGAATAAPDTEAIVRRLERDLEQARTDARRTLERSRATEEEYKSSNEELQSMNEELRSASEELETSREELQSLNEELTTLNQELKHNVEEVGRANSDLHNLMNATAIATVFLDRDFRIVRYTPGAVPLFNLIPSDVGRPFGDLKQHVNYPEMEADARQVLSSLVPVEREVAGPEESWFLARLLPYRSLDDRIVGLVLTLVDITARRMIENTVRLREEQFRSFVTAATDTVYRMSPDWSEMRYLSGKRFLSDTQNSNPAWLEQYIPVAERRRVQTAVERAIRAREIFELEHQIVRADGTLGWTFSRAVPLLDAQGEIVEWIGMATDVSLRKRSELNLTFLAEISQDLVQLTDLTEAMTRFGARIVRFFGIKQFIFVEHSAGYETSVVSHGWHEEGVRDLRGTYRTRDFLSGELLEAVKTGASFTVNDAGSDPRIDAEPYEALGARAFIVVPLGREGEWRYQVSFIDDRPREWRADEVALIVELTNRIWTRLESARAEAAVRASNEQYRTLFNSIDEGFCTIEVLSNAAGKVDNYHFLSVNPAFERQTGLPDPVGKTAHEVLPQLETFWFETYERVALTGEATRFEHEVASLGRYYDVYAFRVGAPEEHCVAVIFNDITKRKNSEQELAMVQERLRRIVDSALEHAIVSMDLERRVETWSPGAERMFGHRAEEVIGQSVDLIFSAEDRAAGKPEQEAAEALAEGRVLGEGWLVRQSGERFWASCAMLPMIPDPGGKPVGFVKIIQDETVALESRKALEQSRVFLQKALRDTEAARTEAETANQSKDHFLAVLSHELRTPLMPIHIALAMLDRRQDLPDAVRRTHDMIKRNIELEVSFIADLLDVTRISRGKMEIVCEDMDLHEALERAVEVSSADIEAKTQRLTVTLGATGHRLQGDFARLQQVFWNLLKNASKFTPEGGAITLRTRNEPGRIVAEVADSGIGMEAEALARVFQPFEQANVSITREFGGLGLGLAIAKSSVEAHGGTLSASSPGPGQGATFTVTLPFTSSRTAAEAAG